MCNGMYMYVVTAAYDTWLRYVDACLVTKAVEPGTRNVRLRLLDKSPVCISSGKPTEMVNGTIRHFITTT
jgi:hypothetical protein